MAALLRYFKPKDRLPDPKAGGKKSEQEYKEDPRTEHDGTRIQFTGIEAQKRVTPILNVACPDVFTSAGQPTTLLCRTSGTPAPEVSWTCNGKPLDKDRFIHLADSSLFIQDTDLQDEGDYLVLATNSVGTAEQMVHVAVIRPVQPELDTTHLPIPIGDFTVRIALLHANSNEGLEDEFANLKFSWKCTTYASKLNVNRNKNRYVNVMPYDHSRVVLSLQDNAPGSDYINASFIDGYNHPNAYIATQGPTPSTFSDFWRMIWEHDCPTIVMVTNLTEDDKVICNRYWPSCGTTTYGSIQVTLKEVENLAEYSIRTFNVSSLAGQTKVQIQVREVRHFHFMGWPNHGVPKYATALLNFRTRVTSYHREKRGPMVVHCSAGVGRTGVFITIDAMLKQMKAENVIDIFNFVRCMRFCRRNMVQTSVQYIFIHDALLEAVMSGDMSTPAPEVPSTLQRESVSSTGLSTSTTSVTAAIQAAPLQTPQRGADISPPSLQTSLDFTVSTLEYTELEFVELVGSGGSGHVWKGRWKPMSMTVAIKKVMDLPDREIAVLSSLDHPSIIQYYGTVIEKHSCFIVTEFAENGSIFNYIHMMHKQPSLAQRLLWLKQVAEGMAYLHRRDLIHRDLKSSNVVLTSTLDAKICDLGSARSLPHTAHQTTIVGTFAWMAPEMLRREPVSKSCDVYSYGIVFWEILTQQVPFSHIEWYQIQAKVAEGEHPTIPDNCEAYLADLMECCWQESKIG